ncbi:TetR/AcrR family transcriptional regulator [Rheinheimera texasensis]|uniref:TetR/AcrR family transcriptional regulator n=1 Tax=Rheinheimera texasensis TaxID=306205 RepID=UPI0032B270EF
MANLSKKEQTHQRILSTAARMIRKDGFEALAVADLMKQAGLTHGGFYAHFANRDALLAEALDYARQESQDLLAATAQQPTSDSPALQRFLDVYLSEQHLAASPQGLGCPVAALSSEFHRLDASGQTVATQTVADLIQRLLRAGAGRLNADQAFLLASAMVGALQLARTLPATEAPALLARTRQQLCKMFLSDSVPATPAQVLN